MTTTQPAPPSLRPFWIALGAVAVALLVVVVTVGLRGGDTGAGSDGTVRVAYTPEELSSAVALEVSTDCASHRLSICTSLENADDYPLPGARPGLGGSGSRYGIAFPTARCLSGVDAESRSATCLVYAGNGMPAGPVTATLVVTTTSAGWFGDEERLTSFLTVS